MHNTILTICLVAGTIIFVCLYTIHQAKKEVKKIIQDLMKKHLEETLAKTEPKIEKVPEVKKDYEMLDGRIKISISGDKFSGITIKTEPTESFINFVNKFETSDEIMLYAKGFVDTFHFKATSFATSFVNSTEKVSLYEAEAVSAFFRTLMGRMHGISKQSIQQIEQQKC
jgi:hypothetical protein